MVLPKQKYICVDDMINRLSSENRSLFCSNDKHLDKIMAYGLHIRTQLKLYAVEHNGELLVFA